MKPIDFNGEKALMKLCVASIDTAADMHKATGFPIGICFFITLEIAKLRALAGEEISTVELAAHAAVEAMKASKRN